ncbi:MAG: cache domain-containing protein [Deltaproteobacteria bacterium]|nr:cache domain-containing protein [Deltaproteobacteria bacterium]
MKRLIYFILAVFFVLFFTSPLMAESTCTKQDVVKAVDEAVAILEREGRAGLEKVGQMRFCDDNYVFVNDFKGKTLMHVMPHLIGKVLIALKDDTGKRFFADFTKMAQSSQTYKDGKVHYNGSGWVSYRWPKPNEKAFSPKISYIRGCLMDDENVYIGAGIYE